MTDPMTGPRPRRWKARQRGTAKRVPLVPLSPNGPWPAKTLGDSGDTRARELRAHLDAGHPRREVSAASMTLIYARETHESAQPWMRVSCLDVLSSGGCVVALDVGGDVDCAEGVVDVDVLVRTSHTGVGCGDGHAWAGLAGGKTDV